MKIFKSSLLLFTNKSSKRAENLLSKSFIKASRHKLSQLSRTECWLVGAVFFGIILRIVLMLCSTGSNDMLTWTYFAEFIDQHGLWNTYLSVPDFNHPPVMGLMAQWLHRFSELFGIPFRVIFKIPMLIADIVTLYLLWSVWNSRFRRTAERSSSCRSAWLALAIFSCNPISILVTAFHGNTDSLCAMFFLLAAYLHRRQKMFWAGVALSASVNVKIVGLLLCPVLFLLCPKPKFKSVLNLGAGFCLAMLPFLLAFCIIPEEFFRNVMLYSSEVNLWGINVVSIKLREEMPRLAEIAFQYRRWGRNAVIWIIILYTLFARFKCSPVLTAATISLVLFLLTSPGWGVQYMVWCVPLLAAVSHKASVSFGLSGGLFIGCVYYSLLVNEFPLLSIHTGLIPDPCWIMGVISWLCLAAWLIHTLCLPKVEVGEFSS